VGTQYVLVGRYLPISWMAAIVPFFMVNNLLLLNQYPDIEADSSVGRNHFPIAYGIKPSNMIYASFILATVVAIIGHIVSGFFPLLSLISIIPVPLAFYSLSGAIKYGENIGVYPHYLAANVATVILMPLLLGVSLIYG
jgi:1,4-dihydroxy-2-naphthoate octaprenyltransferase